MASLLRTAFALLCVGWLLAAERPSAPWPPPEGRLRVIIDTDAANEIDDQYALALALGWRERLNIEGLVAAHFGLAGGSLGIEKSYREIHNVLEKVGLKGDIPVKRGSDPIVYRDRPPPSEGVDFIIERARAGTPEDPLWLVLLGPVTDAVSALLQAPDIADRLIVFWHGRTQWPVRCWNFNAYNDIKAVQLAFELPSRFVLFDTGTYVRIHPDEGRQRFGSNGALGTYLVEIRDRKPHHRSPRKGFFDLGDIAALVDPTAARWERVEAPRIDHDLRYDFSRKQGEILRIFHIESDRCFDLLEEALVRISRP